MVVRRAAGGSASGRGSGVQAPFVDEPVMTVDEAWASIVSRTVTLSHTETVPLAAADGRVLAEDVTSAVALPRFDNSAMDGWAVRAADLSLDAATRLPVGGRIPAGHSAAGIAASGVAVRIFTGAPLPADADLVIMQEDAEPAADGTVLLPALPRRSDNIRRAGEDVALGSTVLTAGRRLRPQDVALAAAAGRRTLHVSMPVRVALFSTGDEIREPGEPLGPAAIHDCNRTLLAALLRRAGAEVTDLGIVRDDPAALAARVAEAATAHDLLVTSGGVSTGEEDHVRAALASLGSLSFWRLAIKPGRPVALGDIRGRAFVGLPGNPVAAFVGFAHVVRPMLAKLAGEELAPPAGVPVRAGFAYRKPPGRRDFIRVRLGLAADGLPAALKHPHDGASSLTSLSETAGLLVLGEAVTEVEPGFVAPFLAYPDLW
jgi:molybdopterin molybdotransferase